MDAGDWDGLGAGIWGEVSVDQGDDAAGVYQGVGVGPVDPSRKSKLASAATSGVEAGTWGLVAGSGRHGDIGGHRPVRAGPGEVVLATTDVTHSTATLASLRRSGISGPSLRGGRRLPAPLSALTIIGLLGWFTFGVSEHLCTHLVVLQQRYQRIHRGRTDLGSIFLGIGWQGADTTVYYDSLDPRGLIPCGQPVLGEPAEFSDLGARRVGSLVGPSVEALCTRR